MKSKFKFKIGDIIYSKHYSFYVKDEQVLKRALFKISAKKINKNDEILYEVAECNCGSKNKKAHWLYMEDMNKSPLGRVRLATDEEKEKYLLFQLRK